MSTQYTIAPFYGIPKRHVIRYIHMTVLIGSLGMRLGASQLRASPKVCAIISFCVISLQLCPLSFGLLGSASLAQLLVVNKLRVDIYSWSCASIALWKSVIIYMYITYFNVTQYFPQIAQQRTTFSDR